MITNRHAVMIAVFRSQETKFKIDKPYFKEVGLVTQLVIFVS